MRPKCLILLVAAAAMVVVSPSLSAAKSNKQHCGPFLIDASTPVAVSTAYRGVQDVRDPTGRRGDEITFVVNTTSPSFALKIGPELHNVSIEVSNASDTLRLPAESYQTTWPESLNYMKVRFASKLFNGTFETDSSGNSQYNVCMSTGGYPPLDGLLDNRIRGSKPYRNATESTAGTDLAPGDNRTCRGSNIKKRGHFPVNVTVVVGFTGEGGSEEEVTVTAPKLFAFPARGRRLSELREMGDATPGCLGGSFADFDYKPFG